MEKDQEFVEMVIKALVENPDKVKVERTVDEMGVLLTLSVDPSDMGKIIGKEGRTAKAVRTLLRVLGARNNSRVNLKIAEPEGGTYVPPSAAAPSTAAADTSASAASAADDAMPMSDDTATTVTQSDDQSDLRSPTSDGLNLINDDTSNGSNFPNEEERPTSII